MSKKKWEEHGVTFRPATMEDFDKVVSFLHEFFYPDEPIFRSTKLAEGTGFVSNYIAKLVKQYSIYPALKNKTSLLALDKEGEIIGAR